LGIRAEREWGRDRRRRNKRVSRASNMIGDTYLLTFRVTEYMFVSECARRGEREKESTDRRGGVDGGGRLGRRIGSRSEPPALKVSPAQSLGPRPHALEATLVVKLPGLAQPDKRGLGVRHQRRRIQYLIL